jgi:hypothetical protein
MTWVAIAITAVLLVVGFGWYGTSLQVRDTDAHVGHKAFFWSTLSDRTQQRGACSP